MTGTVNPYRRHERVTAPHLGHLQARYFLAFLSGSGIARVGVYAPNDPLPFHIKTQTQSGR